MSAADSPHNSHLLFIGQQCHSPQCYMVDFLPFTCEHCKFAFCADHYRPAEHSCDKYDAAKHDRVAPQCPLCNTPVAIPPQQDPNVRMEEHIERECGRRARPGSTPVCARGRCGKRLFAPIKCNSCGEQFCAAHRFPSAHGCAAAAAPAAAAPPPAAASRFASRTSAAGAAAMAAMKRNANATAQKAQKAQKAPRAAAKQASAASAPAAPAPAASAPAKPAPAAATPATKPASAPKHGRPFSKTDRRARAEQESQLRAMRERAKKGLLSEREQVMLAEAEAGLAGGSGKKNSECVAM